ncbi:MAG: PAS domain-containing protein [Gallionella sp.]|nr:PAS domain-containing protein [Gallionella sp.]
MTESLHESAHFMKMIADFMPGMVGYWTRDLRSTFANREYLNWFGKSTEEMHGVPVQDLLGGELFRKHEPYIRAALAGQPQKFDYTLALPGNEIRETLVHYIPHLDGSEVQGLFVLILDVTERKNMELALVSAAEEHQRLIGQELHDNLGQQIAAIAYQAQALERKISASKDSDPGNADAATIAASIATQAQHAVMQCKHLARGLLPLELETNGLMSALRAFASSISSTYGVVCDFVCIDDIDIGDDELALSLYRIAQEAVHNSMRHGGARNLTIALKEREGLLSLSISDDGCGLEGLTAKGATAPGMGIGIMQYRALRIGATLKLGPRAAGGTEVLIERQTR